MKVRKNAKESQWYMKKSGEVFESFPENQEFEIIGGTVSHYVSPGMASDFMIVSSTGDMRWIEMGCFDPVDDEARKAYDHSEYKSEYSESTLKFMEDGDEEDYYP